MRKKFKHAGGNKTHRKEYTKSKRFAASCRNHGSCEYCKNNHTYHDKKNRNFADSQIKEFSK